MQHITYRYRETVIIVIMVNDHLLTIIMIIKRSEYLPLLLGPELSADLLPTNKIKVTLQIIMLVMMMMMMMIV